MCLSSPSFTPNLVLEGDKRAFSPSYPIILLALCVLNIRTSSCHHVARAGERVLGYLGNAALAMGTGPTWLRPLVALDLPWWPLLFFTLSPLQVVGTDHPSDVSSL